MSRTNIFELLSANNSFERDAERITTLATEVPFAKKGEEGVLVYSLFDFVDKYCFRRWANRGRCINVYDFLDTIGVGNALDCEPDSYDSFFVFVEAIYNFWYLAMNHLKSGHSSFHASNEARELKRIMDDVLSENNLSAHYYTEQEKCIIIEKSPQVTAAAEASAPELAWEIIRYNHRELAGDVAKKKAILKALGDELEGRKAEISSINSTLYNTITGALNNLNIRHNNVNPDNKSTFKQVVADMPAEELEQHYDDLYQLILLAIMEMDNVDRQRDMKQLIQSVNMKNER